MRRRTAAICAVLVLAVLADTDAAELHAKAAAQFEGYIRLTEARLEAERSGSVPLLWVERLSGARREQAYERIRHGEIVVARLETRDSGRLVEFSESLCHHWVATVLIPTTRLHRVVALMQAYDGYQDVYRPAVRRSKTMAHDGDRFRVYLQLGMKKVVTAVFNTESDVRYIRVGTNRMQVRSQSTRIAEVREPGTAQEEERPIGRDSGFLWRFNNYCALDEREEGTYVQCESVSLSRSIPLGLGWLIEPFVTGIPKESLEFTLKAMRNALVAPSSP